MADIELKDKGLKQLMAAFKGEIPQVKVGILGDKSARDGKTSNAAIGAAHEYGTTELPIRSFLRTPLNDHLSEYLQNAGAFDPATFKDIIKEGSILNWVKKIGVVAEQVVQEAFASGGFGQWKPSNMDHKKVKQTLIETQQLRNSITSKVE